MLNDVKSLYLPMRHDAVTKAVFISYLKKHVGEVVQFPKEREFIKKHGDFDMEQPSKTCAVVEISCPADVNILKKTKEYSGNPSMSVRYHLPLRHDALTKICTESHYKKEPPRLYISSTEGT